MTLDPFADVFMRMTDPVGMSLKSDGYLEAHVLILSYNRPKMLKEAIMSALTQNYNNITVWVLDDASDFDMKEIHDDLKDNRVIFVRFPDITMEERVAHNRVADNINFAIEKIPKDAIIFYLCDDDLLAPNWIPMVTNVLEVNQDRHIVQGQLWSFWGDDVAIAKPGMPYADKGPRFESPYAWWSTGTFAHRGICWHDENIKWHFRPEGHSQDAEFILRMWHAHANLLVIDAPAYFRREHQNTLSARLGKFKEDGKTWRSDWVIPPISQEMLGAME